MVPPTRNQIDGVSHTEATYGALMALAAESTATARLEAVGPFQDAHVAAATVGDFERFLAVAGRHLELLLSPTPVAHPRPATSPRQLATALSALSSERHGGNAWTGAGDHLGIAHDLLATHVGPSGDFRTSEAVLLGDADVQGAAVARVSRLVHGPLAVAPGLLESARQIQPGTDPPLSPGTTAHVRHAVTRLERLVATPLPVTLTAPPLLAALDELPPVRTKVGIGTPRAELGSGLATWRLLRQLLYRQSRGLEPANAHSLQELCELAVATCTTAERLLPYATSPLGRVTRASAVDRLRTAGTLWGGLSSRLYPRIQGLSKAPAIYHDAVQRLISDARHGGGLNRAILASLPHVADQAADITTILGTRGELVIPTRAPASLVTGWRPITPTVRRELSGEFAAAGTASRVAHEACRRTSDHRHAALPSADLPRQSRGLQTGVSQ